MRHVTLERLYNDPTFQKYIFRSGLAHAIAVAENAFEIALRENVSVDLACKAALLHDIGHYTWYRENGEWDYEQYRENDIHAIKGASRAHELLVRCGEDLKNAKQIAIAILLHTDSYLPAGSLHLEPLQKVVARADTMDEEPGGRHHYRAMDPAEALKRIRILDTRIDRVLKMQTSNHASETAL